MAAHDADLRHLRRRLPGAPLGGIIMAHFGDLLGRKKMFTLSIFMMAVPT